MQNKRVDVIIPTYKPGSEFVKLLEMLEKQSYNICTVRIINTDEKLFDHSIYEHLAGFGYQYTVTHILPSQFDHGRTRHEGIMKSDADYCLFMTQDAVPADEYLVENLLKAFSKHSTAVAYARQLPKADAKMMEKLGRSFNYPDKSRLKTKTDLKAIGIKAIFCSDVCAMYDREKYLECGGFIRKAIFNEDMIMAYNFLMKGYYVAYIAEAKVYHSHNYTNIQQLRRNFDLGVSQKDNEDVFGQLSSESEGIKYILKMTSLLWKNKRAMEIPYLYINTGFRFIGYKLGKNYSRLPRGLVMKCTMNKNYWLED